MFFDQGDLSLLEQNDIILINDGETVLEVEKFYNGSLYCVSKTDSVISPNANVYNEKIYSKLPFISEKDKLNLNDAIRYKADFIAVSHVENKKDLEEIQPLQQLRDAINVWEAKLKVTEGKDAFIIKKAIIEMRKD